MKITENKQQWLIVFLGIVFSGSMVYFALSNEAERVQKEQQRRSEMYKFIGDENEKH
jgi:hypothetical protein